MTSDETLKLLESLITWDDNLLIWRSDKDSGPRQFMVWSTKLGGGLAKGRPTLGAALFAFKEANAEALKAPSKPFVHSSSSHRPTVEQAGEYRAATMKENVQ